jgi:hypothetical protein
MKNSAVIPCAIGYLRGLSLPQTSTLGKLGTLAHGRGPIETEILHSLDRLA